MEKPERNHRGSMQERRFLLPISLLALVMATVALINASKAEEPSPAHKITDGRPWKMTTDGWARRNPCAFPERHGQNDGRTHGPVPELAADPGWTMP